VSPETRWDGARFKLFKPFRQAWALNRGGAGTRACASASSLQGVQASALLAGTAVLGWRKYSN